MKTAAAIKIDSTGSLVVSSRSSDVLHQGWAVEEGRRVAKGGSEETDTC